ncbi:MAG: ABC transporter permease subunit [Proteobacteria bacterium]|nr:ABC transporter permease subunit [Pseudomonadota bacterium]
MKRALDFVLLIVVGFVFWEAMHLAAPFALTSPVESVAKAWSMALSPVYWPHVAETAKAFAYALLLAVGGGLALGLSLGLNRTSAEVAEPIMISVYSLPKVTLYPVILLVFGLGLPAKVAFGTIHGIIPVAIFAMNAVRNLPNVHLKTGRVLRLSRWQTLTTIVVPGALPEIVSGLRIGFSVTLLGVLIGEMFASQRGVGYVLMSAIGVHDVATIMASIVLLAIVAVSASAFLLWLDHRLHHRAS